MVPIAARGTLEGVVQYVARDWSNMSLPALLLGADAAL